MTNLKELNAIGGNNTTIIQFQFLEHFFQSNHFLHISVNFEAMKEMFTIFIMDNAQ